MKHNFRELTIWKRSMDMVVQVYKVTRSLPDYERFAMVSQMTRSAVSIPSNIAEGTSRITTKEITRFLDIALGSSYELETQLALTAMVHKVSEHECNKLIKDLNEIQKMIGGFKKKINQTKSLSS